MAAQAESLSSCFIAICRKTYGQTFRQTSASGRRSKRLKWLRLGGFAIVKAMPDRKPRREDASRSARPEPVSLAPLSFEDALKALAATPPIKESKRRPSPSRKPKRKKKTA